MTEAIVPITPRAISNEPARRARLDPKLFTNPNCRISPYASITIPDWFSARPIAVRRGSHIDGWRRIVAWGGGCGPDNRSYGKSTYEPRAQVSVACEHWRCRSTRDRQRRYHCCCAEESFHASPRSVNNPWNRVALTSNREISGARKGSLPVMRGPLSCVSFLDGSAGLAIPAVADRGDFLCY